MLYEEGHEAHFENLRIKPPRLLFLFNHGIAFLSLYFKMIEWQSKKISLSLSDL